MNRHDILALATERGDPCVTITLPTHRTAPDNFQDSIRLKNLVREAGQTIINERGKREAQSVVQALEDVADTIDHQYNLDGLALFASTSFAHSYRVPFPVPERVVIGETFFTRDLVHALIRSPRYWVLSISEQPTRLFEASRENLEEINEGSPFPITYGQHGGRSIVPVDPAINTSKLRDAYHRGFMRSVDQALRPYLVDDPLPLAVVGVDRWQSFFREVSRHADAIGATLVAGHESTPPHELGKLIWPLMSERVAASRKAIFEELEAAVGGQRSASTLGEVWRLAQEGRGKTLVVEENYHAPARIDERGLLHPLPDDATLEPNDLEDAVDEIALTVLSKGGRLVFVDDGTLEKHSRIALILRY